MFALDRIVCPERRLLSRLVSILRSTEERPAFPVAGEALASAMISSLPDGAPDEAEHIADSMVGALLRVQDAEAGDADRRVRCALGASVLAIARPHTRRACEEAAAKWMGFGLGSPNHHRDEYALAARVLLALWLGDTDGAADAVYALSEDDRLGVSGVLHDWVVARRQGHGPSREAACFEHFLLAFSPRQGDGAAIVLLAAAVAARRAGRDLGGAIDLLNAEIRRDAPEIAYRMVH